jgi:UDP-2,3-diacylglucosamine pyrophosphatase LpxH
MAQGKDWSIEITDKLLEYATEKEKEKLQAIISTGSLRKAADFLGINERGVTIALSRVKAKAAKQGYSPEHDMIKTVPEGFKLRGTSTLYGKDGNQKLQWVKTSIDAEKQYQLMLEAVEALTEDLPKIKPTESPICNDDLMAIYPIGDAHIGAMSWHEESGDDWDLKIAEQKLCGVFSRCVKSAPNCKQATIINLGDWFHRDNQAGITERSHNSLDCDGRYAKMIRVGIKIMRTMITECLARHESVRVINVIGNHDDTGALFLSAALANIYENEPRITIDTSPSVFNYVEFGKVLIGAHHGHTCKADKLAGVMAANMPEAWGRTKHRIWLTGHIHHDSTKEYPGVSVESFCTIADKDAYASAGGWRSRRNTKCIIMHREFGEIERHTIDIGNV